METKEVPTVRGADILKHLGVIKNELLIFAVLVVIITNGFAVPLGRMEGPIPQVCGALMHLSTIPMIFGFGMFYAYAMIRLPGTKQELMFEKSAEKALDAHAKALETAPKKSR